MIDTICAICDCQFFTEHDSETNVCGFCEDDYDYQGKDEVWDTRVIVYIMEETHLTFIYCESHNCYYFHGYCPHCFEEHKIKMSIIKDIAKAHEDSLSRMIHR